MSTNNNKILSNSNQKLSPNIYGKRPVLKCVFNKVSGLQPAALSKKRLRHRCFPVKFLRTRFFYRAPPDECFLEEDKILVKTVPIAIPNDISNAYY